MIAPRLFAAAGAAALIVLAAGTAGCSKQGGEQRRETPAPAPANQGNVTIESFDRLADVPLVALDGSEYRLSHYRGNIVVLCLFATWNKDCVEQLPALDALHRKIKSMQMTVLGVAIDEGGARTVAAFLEKHPVSFPVFANGADIANDLGGIRKLPTTFILLRDGSIFDKAVGLRSMRYFDERIKVIRARRL